jgi:nicotinate-nucleotide adenylyltransferase
MKIGIMGGTFDPPHLGHVVPAEEAAREYALDQVWYVPNYVPPHKVRAGITNAYHRAAMVALAIQHYSNFLLNTRELCDEKPAFTFDTMNRLRKENSGEKFFFILGTDSFLEIDTWYRYTELIDLCEFIMINRGDNEEGLRRNLERLENTLQKKLGNTFHFSDSAFIPVSSTEVRAALSAGKSVTGMVSPEVEHYIHKHSLYQRREVTSD